MDILKQKFQEKAAALKTEIKNILQEHGEQVVDKVTLSQIYGGTRNVKTMIWETSELDPMEGIKFRGYSIPELKNAFPKAPTGKSRCPKVFSG